MSDNRLTILEKKILQGYLLIRNNKSSQVIQELKDSPISEFDFVRNHHDLILGICYNNVGNHTEGERLLRLAVKGFEKESYHQFTALFNLVILLSNTGKILEMAPVIKRMEAICPEEKLARLRLLRCQFIYACDASEETEARKLIQKINKVKKEFSESDLNQHLLCEFMFYVKYEELESAQKVLEEIKTSRNYSSSDNYIFMKKLLSHLREDSPIYVYERDFDSISFLFEQLKVIESLQGNNPEDALKYWSMLKERAPHLYLDDFKYNGEKCLFSLCLDKHFKTSNNLSLVIDKSGKTLCQLAYDILAESERPIHKALFFELIYGESPIEKSDETKLSRLISKVRSAYHVEVEFKKGTYFMLKNSDLVKKA